MSNLEPAPLRDITKDGLKDIAREEYWSVQEFIEAIEGFVVELKQGLNDRYS